MATGMNPSVYDVKEKVMDDLENQFHKKLNNFTADAFPDLSSLEFASDNIQDETMKLREDFEKLERTLSQKLKDAQQSFSEKLEDAQNSLSKTIDAQQTLSEKLEHGQQLFSEKLEDAQQSFSEKLEDAQQSFSEKLEGAQQTLSEKLSGVEETASYFQKKVDTDLKKLNKAKESHTHQILGLRKLQKLLCDKTKISQTMGATAPSTTLASASAGATPHGPPKSLSHRSTFSVRSSSDAGIPNIYDMKLLPGGLVVLTDVANNSVKLYDSQGCHIHTQALEASPCRMTLMELSSESGWDLCVTLWAQKEIALMGVTPKGVNIKRSIKTSKAYMAIAAVTTRTLAAGCLFGDGIDLIDLSGNILYKMSSVLEPRSMVTTEDQCLLMSLCNNSIAKLKMEDHSTIFSCKVKQVEHPKGVAYSMGGYFFVSDGHKRTLHLIDQDGVWIKNLWAHPGGEDVGDRLFAVSLLEQRFVCSTAKGTVFVMDVL